MIRRPPRSTQSRSSAASDVYKRQGADMVDAWLSAKLCVKPAFDKHGKFVGWEENAGGEYRYLSCYHVVQEGFRSEVSDDFPKAT